MTSSSTRSEIGCIIVNTTPGKNLIFSLIALAISSCVQPSGHSSLGFKLTKGVDSFCACGSAGLSPRPKALTTDLTPGTSMIAFMALNSMLIDSSMEIFGTRSIPGTIEPSFISGINDVPKKGIVKTEAINALTAINTTFFSLVSTPLNISKYGVLIFWIIFVSSPDPPFKK